MNGTSALQALRGKRIGVLGYGVNHHHLVPWLTRQGFSVTVRDKNEKVTSEIEGVTWDIRADILSDLDQFDVIFRSPSIPYYDAAIQKAVQKGIVITSQTKLFFQLAPCEIIGVTGSKGKGTTATLLSHMLTAGYTKGKTYLAGNIGVDPFS
ncbi:MAG: UDP-N-acetylmuramoyl-L-alanine--D-glutamate ligase, partial [Candidatus Paceibacterota bacterium]